MSLAKQIVSILPFDSKISAKFTVLMSPLCSPAFPGPCWARRRRRCVLAFWDALQVAF